jgi:uncharacterized SAM-binding protein YcdF (DUF218 family)
VARALVVHGHHDWPECRRRVLWAQGLFRPGDTIVFSGRGEARPMADLFGRRPRWLEDASTTTVENAERCAGLLLSLGFDRVTVVSSWWHAPRVWWCWRGRGVRVRVEPAPGSWRYVPGELRAWAEILFRLRGSLA